MLERVGLADRAEDRVGGYSLDMRQRLGIARCLLSDPRLLILDEPMNGLDPAGILETRYMIRSLVNEGRTVVISSHPLDEVEKTRDAVAILDRGRLIAEGPLSEIADGGRQILIGCDDTSRGRRCWKAGRPAGRQRAERRILRGAAGDPGPGRHGRGGEPVAEAGVSVDRLEPVRATLEERFLEITSRLEATR